MEISEFNANSEDPDQTPRSAASDLGLHCLPMSFLWDAMLKWVKSNIVSRHICQWTPHSIIRILWKYGLPVLVVVIRLALHQDERHLANACKSIESQLSRLRLQMLR